MIKVERWEDSLRRLCDGKGVRRVYDSYEAHINCHGKFLYCGTYPTEEEAREAVIITKIKILEASIIAHGDDPAKVVECVDEGYFASPRGNIYNRHGDLMIGCVDRCGYRHTILNRKQRNIHRVIAETFIPNPQNKPCVNHKDGNKLNNDVANLEWCTHSENTIHSFQTGLQTTNRWGKVNKYGY